MKEIFPWEHGNVLGGGTLHKQLSLYIASLLSNFTEKRYFHGNMRTLGRNLMQTILFLFPASFQFHKKEIFRWEHGNVGGGGEEPYTNSSLFISLLLSNFINKEIFSWEHGNIGNICKFSGPDSKHKNCHII
jgi:hypothetical protein